MNDHDSSPKKISISYEDLQAVPEVRIGSQTTVEPQGAENTTLPQGTRRKNTAVILSLLGVILVLTLFVVLSLVLIDGNPYTGGTTETPPATPGTGLTKKQLALASPEVFSFFSEDDVLRSDEDGGSGSCCVLNRDGSRLYLVTNHHCLSLFQLALADNDGSPELSFYMMQVKFPSGKVRDVEAFSLHSQADLAVLGLNAEGLVENQDYIILPHASDANLSPLDKVVAVGNPHEFSGTLTAGAISRLWENGLPERMPGYAIQHSAPINHGNSGGPLFIDEGGRYRWIGINTQVHYENDKNGEPVARADGIGFAIHVREVLNGIFSDYYSSNATGAIEALREHYGVHATNASGE